jgi:hypothetical protein
MNTNPNNRNIELGLHPASNIDEDYELNLSETNHGQGNNNNVIMDQGNSSKEDLNDS